MKSYSAKVKRSAPAVSGAHSYIHHPTSALQQDQQTVMRNILRPEEVQVNQDIGEHEAHSHPEANHDLTSAPLSTHATTLTDGGNSGAILQRSETNETEQEQQRLPEENELEETVQAKTIQPNFVDMLNTKPSGFDYARPKLNTQQANIHHILHSTGAQAKLIQCQSDNEEEELIQTKRIQRQADNEEEEESLQTKLIQRQSDNEEEEPIQTKHIQRQPVGFDTSNASLFGYSGSDQKNQRNETRQILHPSGIQAKLSVGQADDKYEQEADRVASQVMAMPNQKLNRQSNNEEEDETVQAKSLSDQITPVVQRQEKLQAKGTPKIDDDAEQKIQQMRGQGDPLPKDVQQETENKIGADFSNVNIHNNSAAHDLNKQVNARAFTLGNDVYFGAGEYAPNTNSGKQLLAHELTHVVQQNSSVQREIQRTATLPSVYENTDGKIDTTAKSLQIKRLRVPTFKNTFYQNPQGKLDGGAFGGKPTWRRNVSTGGVERNTGQITKWEAAVRAEADSKVERKLRQAHRTNVNGNSIYYFSYNRGDSFLFGTEQSIKERSRRPMWTNDGVPVAMQVDHQIEHQTFGLDEVENMWLLAAGPNGQSGREIRTEIRSKVSSFVSHVQDKVLNPPTDEDDARTHYSVYFDPIRRGLGSYRAVRAKKGYYTQNHIKSYCS